MWTRATKKDAKNRLQKRQLWDGKKIQQKILTHETSRETQYLFSFLEHKKYFLRPIWCRCSDRVDWRREINFGLRWWSETNQPKCWPLIIYSYHHLVCSEPKITKQNWTHSFRLVYCSRRREKKEASVIAVIMLDCDVADDDDDNDVAYGKNGAKIISLLSKRPLGAFQLDDAHFVVVHCDTMLKTKIPKKSRNIWNETKNDFCTSNRRRPTK